MPTVLINMKFSVGCDALWGLRLCYYSNW